MVQIIMLVVIAATIVEFITEGMKIALPKISGWIVSLVIALALCLSGKLMLLSALGFQGMYWVVDAVITALLISRGSSALHGFLKKLGVEKSGEEVPDNSGKTGRANLTTILISLTLISLLAGCGLFSQYQNLSPLDKAVVTADRLSVWYTGTHKSVTDLYAQSTPEKQLWLRKEVNPKVNTLKGYIVGYVDTVNLWKATGKEPLNLVDILNKIDVLSRDVLTALKE